MLPVLDMVNHDNAPTTMVRMRAARAGLFGAGESDAAVELVALNDLPAGTPLTRRYGSGAVGAELLVDFGFLERQIAASAILAFELEDEVNAFSERVLRR